MEREFSWLFEDILKNFKKLSYEAEFAFFWQISKLLGIGELEVIVLNMEVNLANDKYFAPNIGNLTSLKS